jgi:hypothetical protein
VACKLAVDEAIVDRCRWLLDRRDGAFGVDIAALVLGPDAWPPPPTPQGPRLTTPATKPPAPAPKPTSTPVTTVLATTPHLALQHMNIVCYPSTHRSTTEQANIRFCRRQRVLPTFDGQ